MLKYYLIPLTRYTTGERPIVHAAYDLWSQTYSEILNQSNEELDIQEFWQKDLLAVLTDEKNAMEVIGLHLYAFGDIQRPSPAVKKYLSKVPEKVVHQKILPNFRYIMTGEYLTVNKSHRGSNGKLPYSQIIVGLCSRVFLESGYELIIGISRKDRKVDQLTQNVGAQSSSGVELHQIHCEVMMATPQDIQSLKNPSLQNWVDQLWLHKHSPLQELRKVE